MRWSSFVEGSPAGREQDSIFKDEVKAPGGPVLTAARSRGTGPFCYDRGFFQASTMEAFLISTGIVALAEIGDKTQLLAFLLAARFRRPLPIIAAIFVATIANHAFAAAVGALVSHLLGPDVLRWVLGLSFIAMAAWIMVPDQIDDDETQTGRFGVFMTTLIAFFLAEMGDKTQVATVALAARYASTVAVVAGTTFGMLLANVPAVLFGERIARAVPLKLVHGIAALIFAVLGVLTLLGAGARFGF
jgi:Ca2+/H+ antiporter, TMEM165/GDT1 family